MNAKIPPDIILITCGVLMWLLTTYVTGLRFSIPTQVVLSGLIMLFGLIIIFFAKTALGKHHTTERPDRRSLPTAKALVTTGPYRFSRNPIYLGMVLLLIGWALILENWFSLIVVPVFILFITKSQIMPEEKVLTHLFGDRYTRYKSRVRRWI